MKEGYIRFNTSFSCTCILVDRGKPPGFVQWQDTISKKYTDGGDTRSDTLQVLFDGQKNLQTYECRGKSTDNYDMKLSYKPNYAYGPMKIMPADGMKYRKFNICTGPIATSVICSVHQDWFNPDIVLVLEGFGDQTVTPTNVTIINKYKRFTFELVLTKGEILTPTCVGHNKVFKDIRREESMVLEVREPPSDPPILSINDGDPIPNGHSLKVSPGRSITISCHVKGGYPQVSQTTLMVSNGKRIVTPGSQSALTLTVTEDLDQRVVECSAHHFSGCYLKETHFTLKVQRGAEITTFGVSNFTNLFEKQTFEIHVDSILELKCSATGRPKPNTMSIQNSLGQVVSQRLFSLGDSLVTTYRKQVSCTDKGRYKCTASNGIDMPAAKEVLILVKCPLELEQDDGHDDDKRKFKMADNSRAIVEFKILGYPKPIRHYLYKVEAQSDEDVEQRKKYIDMKTEDYKITFLEVDELYSIMELTILNMVDNGDAGHYRLEIGNGIGKDLDITFEIVSNNGVADGVSLAPIIGGVFGVILFIIIIAISLILVRRNIQKNRRPNRIPPSVNELMLKERNIPKSSSTDHHEEEQDSKAYENIRKENPEKGLAASDYDGYLRPQVRQGLNTSPETTEYEDLIDYNEYERPIDLLQKKNSNITHGATYENSPSIGT